MSKKKSKRTEAEKEKKAFDETEPDLPVEAPVKATKPPAPKKAPVQLFGFNVFEKLAGVKPDQLAGFKNYAKRTGIGPRSIKEWKADYQKFLARPIR